jgi:sigma-B regulation protein RsbU (phosphoserine phosphatase)
LSNREASSDDVSGVLLDDDPEQLYEGAPCGYLSTTPEGTVIKVNQTFLTLTGFSREDLLGRRTFSELLTGGGRIYHETHFAPMLQMQGSVGEIALEIVRADGERLPVLVNSTLERDDDGNPRVVRTAVFDATERRRYEQELLDAKRRAEESEARAQTLARTLQETLIPPTPPDIPGLDIATAYRPAGAGAEVGGDFYDVFQIGEGDWAVVLGDVCGKGVDAAVVTALVRHTLRALAVQMPDPRQVLAALNRVLLGHSTGRFCTLVVLRLHRDADGWRLTTSTGGHPLPLLCRPGEPPRACGTPGPLIGVMDDPDFEDWRGRLEPGSTLLLFTDGVTEGRQGLEQFGDERLKVTAAVHADGSAEKLAYGVLEETLGFQGGQPRDDIAMVAVRAPEL